MNMHGNVENLSRRDQRWVNLGLTLGYALKRVLNREDFTPGAPLPAGSRF